jgi:hypothetical protein
MHKEKTVQAVLYICPNCQFEMFESVEALKAEHGFDGKNLKNLPYFECHGCHQYMVGPYKIQEIPASWLEPF